MEDDNGLELSLGLSCGGSSGKSKVDIPSDTKLEAGSRSDTNASDPSFKNFFETSNEHEDSKGKQKSDPILTQKDFWTDFAKFPASAIDVSHDVPNNLSQFTRYQELWASKNKTTKISENASKRKMPFEEVIFPNKQEKVVDYTTTSYQNPTSINVIRNSHVSNPTENVSTGENEDIAESEREGSNSWLISQHEDKSKCSDISKFTDKHVLSELSGIGSKCQKESYPMPAKVATTSHAPNPSRFPSPCVMQVIPVATNEHSSGQALNTSNLQHAFGYPSVQLPTLETGSSWAFGSLPRQVTSLANKGHTDGAPSTEHSDVKTSHGSALVSRISSPATAYEVKSLDIVKANGKHTVELTTSSKIQDDGKENFSIFRPKEPTRQPIAEGFMQRVSTIKPGIASEIKFGGGGSCPNLPWVSTTAPGPNGETISGVTYKYSQNQVKIVCACHGTHMTPEEFVQHASADPQKPEDTDATFLNNNPTASTKS